MKLHDACARDSFRAACYLGAVIITASSPLEAAPEYIPAGPAGAWETPTFSASGPATPSEATSSFGPFSGPSLSLGATRGFQRTRLKNGFRLSGPGPAVVSKRPSPSAVAERRPSHSRTISDLQRALPSGQASLQALQELSGQAAEPFAEKKALVEVK